MQASPALDHQRLQITPISVVRKIHSQFGIRSFWRGTLASLSYSIPSSLLFFSLYEHWKTKSDAFSVSIAAAKARSVSVTVFLPIEFIRTRLQATISNNAEGAFDIIKRVFYEDSFFSYWRGLFATLLRDIPFSAVYFGLYEYNKKILLPK